MDRRMFLAGGILALVSLGNVDASDRKRRRRRKRRRNGGEQDMSDPRYFFYVNDSKPGVIYILDTQNQDKATLEPQLVAAGWRNVTKKRAGQELGGDQSDVDGAKSACMFGQVGRAGSRFTCLGQGVN